MFIPAIGETIVLSFTTRNPVTGQPADADITPTFKVYEGASDTEILSGNATKRTGVTGLYRISIAVTAANGFDAGNSYNVIVTSTVTAIVARVQVEAFQARQRSIDELFNVAQAAQDK